MPSIYDGDTFSVFEAATLLRVSRNTIKNAMLDGRMPYYSTGNGQVAITGKAIKNFYLKCY